MSIWQRQFDTPTMQGLIGKLNSDHRNALTTLRSWLGKSLGVRPALSYIDVAWHWCEQYTLDASEAGDLRAVYLIPDPQGARVAVCCSRRFFEAHSAASLPKWLHAGLGAGVCVGHLAWCEWNISSQDDVQGLISMLEQMLDE